MLPWKPHAFLIFRDMYLDLPGIGLSVRIASEVCERDDKNACEKPCSFGGGFTSPLLHPLEYYRCLLSSPSSSYPTVARDSYLGLVVKKYVVPVPALPLTDVSRSVPWVRPNRGTMAEYGADGLMCDNQYMVNQEWS